MGRTAFTSIIVVEIEVVLRTALIGGRCSRLPKSMKDELLRRWEYARVLAEQYGTMTFGPVLAMVRTHRRDCLRRSRLAPSIPRFNALIGVFYMMVSAGEMRGPPRLNDDGVPLYPLFLAVGLRLTSSLTDISNRSCISPRSECRFDRRNLDRAHQSAPAVKRMNASLWRHVSRAFSV